MQARVDDVTDSIDGNGRLGYIGRQYDLASIWGRRLKHLHLLLGRQRREDGLDENLWGAVGQGASRLLQHFSTSFNVVLKLCA
jgi:hypothetical protein